MKTKKVLSSVLLLFFATSSLSLAQGPRGFLGQLLGKDINLHVNFDTDTPIMSDGTVALRAQCVLDEGGKSIIRIYATTTSATGTVLDGSDNFQGEGGDFLLPGTQPKDAELLRRRVDTGETWWDNDTGEGFVLDTSRLADTNRVYGFKVDGESGVLGITPEGCYISIGLKRIRHYKNAKNSEPLEF